MKTNFGCFLPQESADFRHLIEVADQCEKLGYDSVWAYDHLSPFWMRSGQALECWTALAAVAEHTRRIRIGSLVTNITLRNPALLAKTATTVDIISDGRLIMGLGTGDRMSKNELPSYGYSFAGLSERVTRLRETILILKAMWTDEDTSFAGKYYRLSHAINRPRSKQAPHPPIWIGGKHHKILDIVAELADGWNYWGLDKDQLAQRSRYLSARCAAFGRAPGQIVKSWSGTLSSLCRAESNRSGMFKKILTELRNQSDPDARYHIASFGPRPNPQSYEAFAEAVANLE